MSNETELINDPSEADAPAVIEVIEVIEVAPVSAPPKAIAPSDEGVAPQWRQNERGLERIRVYGRASLSLPNGVSVEGRIYDMTRTGISVVLDSRLAMKREYALHINIFRNGRLHNLRIQVLAIHESLVGKQGFKHGFQFVTPTDEFTRAIDDILA